MWPQVTSAVSDASVSLRATAPSDTPVISAEVCFYLAHTFLNTHTHMRTSTSTHTDTPAPVVCQPPPLVSITLHFVCFVLFSTKTLRSFKCLLLLNAALLHTIFGVFYHHFFFIFYFFAEWLIGFSTGVQSVDWLSVDAGHQILVFVLFIFNFYFFIFIIQGFFFTTAFRPSNFSKLDLGKTHTLFNITVPMPNTFCSISKFN